MSVSSVGAATQRGNGRRLWRRVPLLVGTALVGAALALSACTIDGAGAARAQPVDFSQSEYRAWPGSFADAVDRVMPAVVNISTSRTVTGQGAPNLPDLPGLPPELREFFERFGQPFETPFGPEGPGERSVFGQGSGFIISPDGLVVTNNHVVAGANEVTVTLQDGDQLDATVIGSDTRTDLAVLRIQSDRRLPYVQFGDSDRLRVGDWVIAVGNPFGLGGTVTAGIISAMGRDINAGPYDDFLQIDAPINRGNSGGPLFDAAGRVVGVNTAIFSPSGGSVGIGFAIPSSMAEPVIAELIEDGSVSRGWLGVRIQPVTEDLAAGFGLPEAGGALVVEVTPGSPSARAGVRQGDVILSFNGRPIETPRELSRVVADMDQGDRVTIEIWRGGERQTLTAVIGALPADQVADAASAEPGVQPSAVHGLELAPLDDSARVRFGIGDDVAGALVVGLTEDAGDMPLRPGDVIVTVDNEPVRGPDDVAGRLTLAEQEGREAVVVLVYRNGNEQFMALRLRRA